MRIELIVGGRPVFAHDVADATNGTEREVYVEGLKRLTLQVALASGAVTFKQSLRVKFRVLPTQRGSA